MVAWLHSDPEVLVCDISTSFVASVIDDHNILVAFAILGRGIDVFCFTRLLSIYLYECFNLKIL